MIEKIRRDIASDVERPERLAIFERSLQRQRELDESVDFIMDGDVTNYRLPNSWFDVVIEPPQPDPTVTYHQEVEDPVALTPITGEKV
jgi:hypothetical protein